MSEKKKILIVDEYGFSRICSAILMSGGYQTDVVTHGDDLPAKLSQGPFDLIVTSYPFGSALFDSLRREDVPFVILTDGIDERLMGFLNSIRRSFCMIKPVDYDKFKGIIKQATEGSHFPGGGYSIV